MQATKTKTKPLTEEDAAWVRSYSDEVVGTFTETFRGAGNRLHGGSQILQRFTGAVDTVLQNGYGYFRGVDEAHNELCIARVILLNEEIRFALLEYEPVLSWSSQSIDFRAIAEDGLTVFVDVKTIKPGPADRWDQFERAMQEDWLPENVRVILSKEWLGGELWHSMYAARGRMLEYTLELERKIANAGLAGKDNHHFILALCGTGFEWHMDELEDFEAFYRSGVHRGDDPFSKAELRFMAEKNLSLNRTISRFACMFRKQGEIYPKRMNWNVQPPRAAAFT